MPFDIDKWQRDHIVQESAATAERLRIREVGGTERIGEARGLRREVTIIEAGWGSSGYYSREMLTQDGPTAFPVGTHMYLDHPDAQEERDRPERTVRDLAATIATTPRMVGDELKAEADIKEHWAPVINALAEDIGLSIRAVGEAEPGEVDGRSGPIITALTEGISVDFVTHAGAGGKVGMLIESARRRIVETRDLREARNVGEWLEAFIHSTFTHRVDDGFGEGFITREERLALSKAIGDALDAFHASVETNAPQLFERDPFDSPEPEDVEVDESWKEAARVVVGEPYGIRQRSGQHCVVNTDTGETVKCHDSRDDALAHQRALMANVPDSESTGRRSGGTRKEDTVGVEEQLSELQETVRQHETKIGELEESRDQEKTRADRAEDALAQERARRVVDEALEDGKEGENPLPELPDRAIERVRETALGGKLPTDEDGKLDKDRLKERVRKAAQEEHEYLEGKSPRGSEVEGAGQRVTESNGDGGNGDPAISEDDKNKLIESFKARGMSDEAAKVAAEGR